MTNTYQHGIDTMDKYVHEESGLIAYGDSPEYAEMVLRRIMSRILASKAQDVFACNGIHTPKSRAAKILRTKRLNLVKVVHRIPNEK